MHEAALDWKVYRMLWAKDIADATFDALRYPQPQPGPKSATSTATSTSTKASLQTTSKEYKKDMPAKASPQQKSQDTWSPQKLTQNSNRTLPSPECLHTTDSVPKTRESCPLRWGPPPGEFLSPVNLSLNKESKSTREASLRPISGHNCQIAGALQEKLTSSKTDHPKS